MIIRNNRPYPIVVYYMSGKNRKSVRIGDNKSVSVSDFSSISPLSKRDVDNSSVTIMASEVITEVKNEEISSTPESKMKKASKDAENYINKEK